MTVTVSVAADRVECRTDQPILDAFLRGSVWMPNSCNQGTCGTCKLRVVSGSVDHGRSPETTLTQAEREQGFALACQATPCGDTVVERLDTAPAGTVHALRDLVGTVSAIEDVARDTRRVLVTLDSPLEFSAGAVRRTTSTRHRPPPPVLDGEHAGRVETTRVPRPQTAGRSRDGRLGLRRAVSRRARRDGGGRSATSVSIRRTRVR